MARFSWPWVRKAQTFSAPGSTRHYSLAMALESGLITDGNATREQALSVPAVLKGRNMLASISTLPLRLLDTNRRPVREALFEQIDPATANVVTLAMTIEDLLFDGVGWWEILERTPMGFPKAARHVDSRRVTINPPTGHHNPLPSGFDPASTLYVDGRPRSAFDFIRFDSPNPPFLVAAKRAVNRAVLLEDAAAMYADNPRPGDYFTPAEGAGALTTEKVESTLRSWIAARKKRSTAFVPETLEYKTVQSPNPQDLQLVQLQQRAALDIANALGVDPEDLGISTTSRTYQNATDRRQDRVNDVLAPYMRAITDRLSMPDVIRNGYRATFVLDDYMKADPKTRWETAKIAHEIGATDIDEIRDREEWPERPDLVEKPAPAALPAPAPIATENAREGSMATFSDETKAVTLRLDDDSTTFRVDAERRVITGRAVIWDRPANNGKGTFTFRPGSVQWNRAAINRVKLLRDHDWSALLGAATEIHETADGLDVKFKVARGPAGDQALAEAEDGALDGLSIGVDITGYEETRPGRYVVTESFLNETSLTPRPAFDDARLTSVAASNTKGNTMPETTPDTAPADLDERIAAAVAAALAKTQGEEGTKPAELAKTEPEAQPQPAVVNPAARELPGERFTRMAEVKEASPYTFDRAGRFVKGQHEFSTDIAEMLKRGDTEGTQTEFGKRVMGHIAEHFDVDRTDVDEIQPAVQRPDMYYEAPANRTPLWSLVNGGALPNGADPFVVPKFNSASGLVADHTEGTEPGSGSFTTTSQTITPTPVSGKVSITRETLERGGNPAASNLIWNRMVREYYQALESATSTFLAGLTAATDVTLTASATDKALAAAVQNMLIALNFAPGYDFSAFAVERGLYANLANAVDDQGRPLFPALGPSNANGTTGNLFQTLNVNGLRAVPSGALAHTNEQANNSWLFDPDVVKGHASAPQRLEFAGTGPVTVADPAGSYSPVAYVDIALWGWKAFYNLDIAGVRQVIYDNTPADDDGE
jgi:HK97 family phage prohead protease